ncbi:uncharacterized protein V1518DRAFT_411706 [Limtongia smithiae]|uniref:uncharacterized protein n=1 Tax=Limtongia smithiae TaxID=1125753 RepID=UPI0034CF5551
MSRLYPRSSLRRAVREHSNGCKVAKTADILVYLNYMTFLDALLREANIEARQAGDKTIRKRHIDKVAHTVLHRFRG